MAAVPQQGGTAEQETAPATFATGQLLKGTIESAVLGRAMPYAIYLPPSYETDPERRFPVVYQLHGAGGQYTEWTTYGLPQTAGEMMERGELTEFIIVMPEGGTGYWANGLGGDGEQWADYLLGDVVPYVDATYRTVPDAADRAIGGLSRGGFGALYLAFTHPSVFSIVAANSPALPGRAADIEGPSVPEDEFADFDPVELARNLNAEAAPHIWLDIGDLDDWRPGVQLLDSVLSEEGVEHELSIGDGGHTQEYWTARAPDYLRFYSSQFAGG
jgi:enterochelin esterase-like enzyme